MSKKLLYNSKDEQDINNLVTNGLQLNLYKMDIANRRIIDPDREIQMDITDPNITINNKCISVPLGANTPAGSIDVNLGKVFTISYFIDGTWGVLHPTQGINFKQFISGAHTTSFYFWISDTAINAYYKGTKIIHDSDYITASIDDPKFIDIICDVDANLAKLYINGELIVTNTSHKFNSIQEGVTTLYFNSHLGNLSCGAFDLYSFKVYDRVLTQDEILKNIEYENSRIEAIENDPNQIPIHLYQTYNAYPLIVENVIMCEEDKSFLTGISGNTWQNVEADLTDIRHVGEPQDDGTYKVEVSIVNSPVEFGKGGRLE